MRCRTCGMKECCGAELYAQESELTKLRKRVEVLSEALELSKDISTTPQAFLVYGVATQALAKSANIAGE